MKIVDFLENERIHDRVYLGNAGMKRAYLHDGIVWMVKFPQSTRNLEGKHLPSYTSSPISEYIGSQIYASLNIPVHETVLGRCQGKIVVGCKDFAIDAKLLEFHGIKNTVDEELISGSFGSSAKGERLSDVLRVIDNADAFSGLRSAVKARFWDMFVTDAFLLNNDRNNGNWGLLADRYTVRIAPVFDNGNSFFNKRNPSLTGRRMESPTLVEQDALKGLSFFTDDNDHHIHPFDYIAAGENEDCNAAVLRFVEHLDMKKVIDMIENIPETAYDLSVMPSIQKAFYIQLLETAYEKGIRPVAERLISIKNS
ncbi:MAG: CtkA family protein [Clostridiales bacterium]|nr:CtkA family protein [Clostridiales bacterium]